MMSTKTTVTIFFSALVLSASAVFAQSGATRPRRVTPVQPTPTPSAESSEAARPRATQAAPAAPAAQASTARAFSLLERKQYEEALKEAKQVASADPKNSEAWKIAGFAAYNLKRYAEAAEDLQRAHDLQRASGEADVQTADALAEAYVLNENYERALPLLVAATARAGAKPDARMLYYRGLAQQKTGKLDEAERSYNEVLKVDPKNKYALMNIGHLAYNRNDHTTAINMLNRATQSDPALEQAWKILVTSYLRRASTLSGPKADADYLAAVRAGESLQRIRDDAETAALLGQALVYAKQYPRAATVLERAAASDRAPDATHYLLGFAYVQAKNFPKAISALARAAAKTPDNAEVYRLLGYSYESSKQYAKALEAYEKGLSIAPADEYFKESAERVRPFAK